MVLRSESVGEQDVADQQGAFLRRGGLPPTPSPPPNCAENVDGDFLARAGARGAYSYSPRDGAATAAARRGGTLRTGYCDREIDEDRPAKFESLTHRDVNFSESEISGILDGTDRRAEHRRRLRPALTERRVRSWLRMNAGGAPNTCKSNG